MAKVLLWMHSNSDAERLKNSLVNIGYEVVIAATMSNLGPLAKAEKQAGAPIQAVIVEVNHDFEHGKELSAVTCAKEIKPPIKIIALCCCCEGVGQAKNAGCAEAFLCDQYYVLPLAISHVLTA
jgi:hypothetical protein